MGSMLAQNNKGGKEQAIYYLSRILTEVETRYTSVEILCLALYFTTCKLRHYMLPCHIHIIAKTDMIKYMLSKPMLTGRIGKWILALSEFSFQYMPQRAIKGQAIADFLVEHQESQEKIINIPRTLKVASMWIPQSKAFSSGESSGEEWIQQEIKRITSLWITHWRLILMVLALKMLRKLGLSSLIPGVLTIAIHSLWIIKRLPTIGHSMRH
ncbi:hypothetical protein ACFX2H_046050 [Malus domestica]